MASHSIYPTPSSPREVIDSAITRLPITNRNELIAILKTHHNAVEEEIKNQGESDEPVSQQH